MEKLYTVRAGNLGQVDQIFHLLFLNFSQKIM
jgi:hypothetical protein